MMAQSPVSVVSPRFCAPYPVDVAIVRKVLSGDFVVNDVNGNLLFKVKGSLLSLHGRRVILDVAGRPIVTLRRKILSAHSRWQVFRGDSSEAKDLIFSAKRSSMIQYKTKLHVFLANNTSDDVCDYTVKGSWFEKSCVVYAGDSSTIVAQILSVHKRWQVFQGDSSGCGGDLLFTTKNSSLVDFKVELDVFLAGNKEERSWDFKAVGNWLEKSCVVYNKDSTPIAQMQKKHKLVSTAFGRDNFHVTVHPQVDCAFIVALVVILGEIHEDKED
ncbi:hypothetical protein CDL12_07606 [Handroanthus impetiginosus]|uniref:Uncharacterized protein n=1 Tax=Handroanthus impetiginosus TaxID=429701 RepID=A0A2G9HQ93_9LAMI|nr:hypothetical protein CDL12_07606 [Handroanthus impetiginosus]